MNSLLAWVDFSAGDRRRMDAVIDLLNERETRDELGLGAIRDALAELLFPGTSTIQTRARYFLFVPWIYREHERRRTPSSEIARKIRADEIKLIYALIKGGEGESDGVIGIERKDDLQRTASSIYWAGLGTLGIRRFGGSQDQCYRAWDRLLEAPEKVILDDDADPTAPVGRGGWDPGLPKAPADFLEKVTHELRKAEAEYLKDRILAREQGSFLGYLVSETKTVDTCPMPWLHPGLDGLPEQYRNHLAHARLFSEAMHGAALLYNRMLAEKSGSEEFIADYAGQAKSWTTLMGARKDAFQKWSRTEFWKLVEDCGARVTRATRTFTDTWLNMALSAAAGSVFKDPAARELIRAREQKLKGLKRARLMQPRALERWSGSSGAGQLNYRWHRVQTIVNDILTGLER